MKLLKKMNFLLLLCMSIITMCVPLQAQALEYVQEFNKDSVGYSCSFTLRLDDTYKDTWLYEISDHGKLNVALKGKGKNLALRFDGVDGTFYLAGTSQEHVSSDPPYEKGKFVFRSPYVSNRYEEDENGDIYKKYYTNYRIDQTTDASVREKYGHQQLCMIFEMNQGDARIKFWKWGDIGDDLLFWTPNMPTATVIRVDQLSSFQEDESTLDLKELLFNVDAESEYYQGCEGYDGEYEWKANPSSIRGQGTYEEAEQWLRANTAIIPVTNPPKEPDPEVLEMRRKNIELAEKYTSKEWSISDKDLPVGDKENSIAHYGKYKDSAGNVHYIKALNGKVWYMNYQSKRIAAAKFSAKDTSSWAKKLSTDGKLDFRLAYYDTDRYDDDGIRVGNTKTTEYLGIIGNKGEQWFVCSNVDEGRMEEAAKVKDLDLKFNAAKNESYMEFKPITEFSEEYIDYYCDESLDYLNLFIEYKEDDKVELAGFRVKCGDMNLEIDEQDITADLAFRTYFYDLIYGEYWTENHPAEWAEIQKHYEEYCEQYKNETVDFNKKDEPKKETEPKQEEKKPEVLDIPVISDGQGISIYVDGKKLDQPVMLVNDRTLVPMRAIFEALGADVSWNDAEKTVTAKKDEIVIVLKIGSEKFFKNLENVPLDTPAVIQNDRTYIPLRAVSEALENTVDWNGETKTITIQKKKGGRTPFFVDNPSVTS